VAITDARYSHGQTSLGVRAMNAHIHKPTAATPKNHSVRVFDACFALGAVAFLLVTFVPPLTAYANAVYVVLCGYCPVAATWLVGHWLKESRHG